jgi:hypothetical protein
MKHAIANIVLFLWAVACIVVAACASPVVLAGYAAKAIAEWMLDRGDDLYKSLCQREVR